MLKPMIIPFLIILGLAMGSFIDALLFRIHAAETKLAEKPQERAKRVVSKDDLSMTRGRSMCESCHTTLQPRDLVPVFSWLSTAGKCRYCKVSIGWQTPVVELITMVAFVSLYLFLPREGMTEAQEVFFVITWLVYAVGLIALAVYDLRYMLLPNRILLPLIALAVVVAVIDATVFDGGAARIREAVIGLGVGGGLFYLLFIVSGGRWIGGGDVKLGFFMGLALGPVAAGVALWTSFNLALIVILPLMLLKIVGRKQPVPFGPFLIVAMLFAAVYGQGIADWYNDTFLYSSF